MCDTMASLDARHFLTVGKLKDCPRTCMEDECPTHLILVAC
jgi:hypothetical protein